MKKHEQICSCLAVITPYNLHKRRKPGREGLHSTQAEVVSELPGKQFLPP